MRQPRRLGLVLAPESGESLASWIDRLGEDMRCPPGLVADDLGLRVVSGAVQRPLSLLFGISATEEQKAAVRAAAGVSAVVFEGMHLSAYDGTVLDLSDLAEDKASVQRVWFREWALFTTSRACPACLAESGGVWMLWWRLAAAAVCPVHRLMLVSHCPGCGLELRRGTERNQGVPRRELLVEPTRCANRTRNRMCGYRLTDLPPVPVDDEICAAQLAYLDAAHGRPHPVAGRCIDAPSGPPPQRVFTTRQVQAAQAQIPPPAEPAGIEPLDVTATRSAWPQIEIINSGNRIGHPNSRPAHR
ncbi:MAG TPA: TniQ family protein [Candidatus Limnocylindrales bacterium]|nr:TniQ family protein [Candidatus Limnocylindrales bacterium]